MGALPAPPFQPRALSLAHLDGKLVAIGGMQEEGGRTTRVDLLDVAAGAWSQGPSGDSPPRSDGLLMSGPRNDCELPASLCSAGGGAEQVRAP